MHEQNFGGAIVIYFGVLSLDRDIFLTQISCIFLFVVSSLSILDEP